ncbi:MAG: hypothetical protein ACKVQW_08715 [Pyrinomonadaceae bacterium]
MKRFGRLFHAFFNAGGRRFTVSVNQDIITAVGELSLLFAITDTSADAAAKGVVAVANFLLSGRRLGHAIFVVPRISPKVRSFALRNMLGSLQRLSAKSKQARLVVWSMRNFKSTFRLIPIELEDKLPSTVNGIQVDKGCWAASSIAIGVKPKNGIHFLCFFYCRVYIIIPLCGEVKFFLQSKDISMPIL